MANGPPPMGRGTSNSPDAASGRPSPRVRPSAPAKGGKLVCRAGPAEGQEFELSGDEAIVGRAPDIAVSVADTSVSRRHVSLERSVDGWNVKDLGSGNGTLLNGEKLEGSAPLRNGDILILGNTELAFVDTDNSTDRTAPPARPVPRRPSGESPRRLTGSRPEARVRVSRQLPAAANAGMARKIRLSGLVILLIVFLAGLGLALLKQQRDRVNALRNAALVEQQKEREQIGEVMQEGRNLAREGRWKEALVKFEAVQKADPAFPELKQYLDKAPKEIESQQKLDKVQALIGEGRLGEAAEQLSQVANAGGLYNPRMKQMQKALQTKLIPRLAEGQAALNAGNLDRALEIANDVLKVAPDERDAQRLADAAEDALAKKGRMVARRDRTTPVAEPRVWEPGVQRFLEGDLAGAAAMMNNCASTSARCKDLLRDIGEFSELHKKLDDLDPKGLRRIMSLDREIAESKSPTKLARTAGVKLGNLLYKQASSAKAAGDWSHAKDQARAALQADPTNAGAKQMLDEADKKVKELYLYGYSNKDSNPDEATRAFRQVIEMTPPDDEMHQKAKRLLEKLSR